MLLKGAKPVGVFVDRVYPPDIIEDHCQRVEDIRHDISVLDEAVRAKKLIKTSMVYPVGNYGAQEHWNLYCQPGMQEDMAALKELFQSDLEGRPPAFEIEKDYGDYLGYKKADISLFSSGGYEALPFGVRQLLERTHSFRQKCRVYCEMHSEL